MGYITSVYIQPSQTRIICVQPTHRDLYYLVKFLPAYALPAGIPSMTDLIHPEGSLQSPRDLPSPGQSSFLYQRSHSTSAPDLLPAPVTSATSKKTTFLEPIHSPHSTRSASREKVILPRADERFLLPAHMPPKYHFFDLFPFSLLVGWLARRGREVKGKKAAGLRAKMRRNAVSHNLPLEISLYLVS